MMFSADLFILTEIPAYKGDAIDPTGRALGRRHGAVGQFNQYNAI